MKLLFDYVKVERTLRRMAHEILERNQDYGNMVLLGIKRNGYPIAKLLQGNILEFEGINIPTHELDISGYRDDREEQVETKLAINLKNKIVILVDDVLYTGRTIRAAMDAVVDHGRPAMIQVATLIDRGHRELPIRADYVGKNIPTRFEESVVVDVIHKKGVYLTIKQEEDNG